MDTVEIVEPGIAINIIKTFPMVSTSADLYEFTRGIWVIDPKYFPLIKYAFAVYKNEIREVYEVNSWHPAGTTEYKTDRDFLGTDMTRRWEFVGQKAPDEMRRRYLRKSIEGRSWGNPIRLFNCDPEDG
jgi:hypothetical protein